MSTPKGPLRAANRPCEDKSIVNHVVGLHWEGESFSADHEAMSAGMDACGPLRI